MASEAQALLDRGGKLGAISPVREQTGTGLDEARRAVGQMVGAS